MQYNAYSIIAKKRDGLELSKDEITWFINSLVKKEVEDYQMSALLMAIYLNGLTVQETAHLTDVMLYSGKVLNFDDIPAVDKHSTGGVGDKTSFILAPIAAACGVKVPMIAGRGLGHTGGTVDKIEAIKGFKTTMSMEQFDKQLKEKGIVLIGQTGEIAPADKKIYALRDVTATIESIPLITASIMSKKLAEGAGGIVMDIKVGNGAFMKSKKDAKALAKSIRETGLRFNKNMMTLITDMNQPLGNKIGNSLEIIESIETLKGKGPKDLTEISIVLAGGMIHLAGLAKDLNAGIAKAKKSIKDGTALEKFRELIKLQGGNEKVVDDYSLLPCAKNVFVVTSPKAQYVKSIDCLNFGMHCVSLGGGRRKASDKIDFGVGLDLLVQIGSKVKKGEVICKIHYNDGQEKIVQEIADSIINKDIKFSDIKPLKVPELICDTQISWSKK